MHTKFDLENPQGFSRFSLWEYHWDRNTVIDIPSGFEVVDNR
jgi:hypothetical protein